MASRHADQTLTSLKHTHTQSHTHIFFPLCHSLWLCLSYKQMCINMDTDIHCTPQLARSQLNDLHVSSLHISIAFPTFLSIHPPKCHSSLLTVAVSGVNIPAYWSLSEHWMSKMSNLTPEKKQKVAMRWCLPKSSRQCSSCWGNIEESTQIYCPRDGTNHSRKVEHGVAPPVDEHCPSQGNFSRRSVFKGHIIKTEPRPSDWGTVNLLATPVCWSDRTSKKLKRKWSVSFQLAASAVEKSAQ